MNNNIRRIGSGTVAGSFRAKAVAKGAFVHLHCCGFEADLKTPFVQHHGFLVDYAFGWTLQKYVENLAGKYGLEVVGVDRHPLGHREYSTFITKAMSKKPDAIYMINFGKIMGSYVQMSFLWQKNLL